MKTTRKETNSSKTIKRPRGRPYKVAKQTGGDTNGRNHQIEHEEHKGKRRKDRSAN